MIALITLTGGWLVKRELQRSVVSRTVVPPTQSAALQQLSQEGQVRRLSSFLDERARAVAALVEYVPSSEASGLRWRNGDTLITTSRARPIVALSASGDATRSALVVASDSMRGDWALVVARRADGGFVSTAGVVGGRVPTRCDGYDIREYVLGVPLPDAFAGAGVFDLEGRVIGIVAQCGSRLAALPVGEMRKLLSDPQSLGMRLRTRFGVVVAPLDSVARSYFGADSGLLVMSVDDGGPADRAGWMPGDVIIRVDGDTLGTEIVAPEIDSIAAVDSHVVVIRRDGALRTTRLTRGTSAASRSDAGNDLGVSLGRPASTRGVAIDAVRPGSPADSAGLHAGDRLIRIGKTTITSAAAGQRLLDRRGLTDSATFVVFERDSVSRGTWLRR